MELNEFKKLMKNNNFVRISKDYLIFPNWELMKWSTGEIKKYKSLEELVTDNGDVSKIIEESKEIKLIFDGGRGASSNVKDKDEDGEMGGGFNHADDRGGKEINTQKLANSRLNYGNSDGNSIDDVIERFREQYGNAEIEYGAVVDELGYVYEHVSGGSSSVSIYGSKGQTVIHNHPSGGNFSDSDLLVSASTGAGIIAVSSNASTNSEYRFTPKSNFKGAEFAKAVKKAKWPKNYSYSKGADWWLKRNATTYGYSYSSKGVPED